MRQLWLLCALLAALCGARGAQAQQSFPMIGLDIVPATVAESGGPKAATATLRRYFSNTGAPLTVRLSNSLPLSIRVPESVTIPSGTDRVEFVVEAIDDAELNGTRIALITASATGFFDTFFALTVTDDEAVFELAITPETISEVGGKARGTLRRSPASATVAEDILLSSGTANALKLPEKVTFGVGQSEVSFDIEAIDNDLFDGARVVAVTARRERSAQTTSRDINLLDNELNLTIEVAETTSEGASAGGATPLFATVSRTRAAAEQGPLSVSIVSNDPSELLGSTGVVMRAGQTSVQVPLQAIDDLLVDGPQNVSLSASATGYNSDTKVVVVTDNDKPVLQLSLNTATANESAIPSRIFGTLRRNTPTTRELIVSLRTNLPTRLSIPTAIRMPIGAVEARFAIRILDNARVDGAVNAGITATAVGFAPLTATLMILDNDGRSVEVSFEDAEGVEGLTGEANAGVGRVYRRNIPLNIALFVTLTSSDPGVVLLDAIGSTGTGASTLALLIPAGQEFGEFQVKTPDNADPTEIRTSTISARVGSVAGGGAAPFDVIDNDDPAQLKILVRSLAPSRDRYPEDKESDDPLFCGPNVDESAGPRSVAVTIRRNTATTSEVIVLVTSSGPLSVPTSVVIPFGQREVTFFATPQDDELRCIEDIDTIAEVTANVAGFAITTDTIEVPKPPTTPVNPPTALSECDLGGTSAQILIVDDESLDPCFVLRNVRADIVPRVTRDPEGIGEIDAPNGGVVLVKRSDDVFDLRLVVDLTSNIPARARANSGASPESDRNVARVILPTFTPQQFRRDPDDKIVYAPAVSVPLSVFNNGVRDECTPLTITPSVVGFLRPGDGLDKIIPVEQVGAGNPYGIRGDTVPFLDAQSVLDRDSLSVDPKVLSESGASGVATGRLRRPAGLRGELIVTLRSSDISEVGVSPANRRDPLATLQVTLPADQNAVSFNVIAIDDALADGNVRAFIEATTNCSTFVDRVPVTIMDNDIAALRLVISSTAVGGLAENVDSTTVTARVSRNTADLRRALIVTLRSGDVSEIRLPATVTIPVGQSSVDFTAQIVDDAMVDGPQRVNVQASAAGLRTSQIAIVIGDDEAAPTQ